MSSERRKYVLLGFVRDGVVPGNMLCFVPPESLLVFRILSPQVHGAWMRTVAGYLKSDYHYANTIIYNNFVLPNPIPEQWDSIEQSAQGVLDARNLYPGASLAKLYNPDNETNYPELADIHRLLDEADEWAYGWDFEGLSWDEKETRIASELFELYNQVVSSKQRNFESTSLPPSLFTNPAMMCAKHAPVTDRLALSAPRFDNSVGVTLAHRAHR